MSRHRLVRVQVYYEYTMGLFDSGDIPNVMSHKMVKNLHLRMQPTVLSKLRTVLRKKCVGTLNEVSTSMGELVVPMDFLVLEKTPYDILIGFLPVRIIIAWH